MIGVGRFIVVIGLIITVICFIEGLFANPQSAVQQIVQELRYVEAIAGLLLIGLGGVIVALSESYAILTGDRPPFKDGAMEDGSPLSGNAMRCAHCTEWVRIEAAICSHCGTRLTPAGTH